jgi:hypothetical protein
MAVRRAQAVPQAVLHLILPQPSAPSGPRCDAPAAVTLGNCTLATRSSAHRAVIAPSTL